MSPFIQQFIIIITIIYRVPDPVVVTKVNKIYIPVFMEFIVEPERKTKIKSTDKSIKWFSNCDDCYEGNRVVMEGFLEEVMFENEWESSR